jgi:hypothetical protein
MKKLRSEELNNFYSSQNIVSDRINGDEMGGREKIQRRDEKYD